MASNIPKMALFPVLVVTVLANCAAASRNVGAVKRSPTITWPKEYHLKGETIYVTAGILEPFEIWYSEANRRARKDLYDGTVKNYYQFSGIYDKNYAIFPVANPELIVETACFYNMKKRKNKTNSKKPYHFLPKTYDFEYKGTAVLGSEVTEWEWIEDDDEKKVRREHRLYVSKVGLVDVPVRYTIQSYDTVKEGLNSHVIINYFDYIHDVARDDVNVKKSGINVRECIARLSKVESQILDDEMDIELNTTFHGYKKQHGKNYDKEEHETRKEIFRNNVKHVINHNRQGYSFKLSVNQFADRSDEEIQGMSCLLPAHKHDVLPLRSEELEKLEALAEDLPEELDMRLLGVVTPVKNQLTCGSCWAFATTAAVEVALAMRNGGRPIDLSEQSLVDCAWGYGNFGCGGGLLRPALKYVYANGIPTENAYGLYMMENGACHLGNVSESEIYKIMGIGTVPPLSEPAFKAALNKHGALTVGIHASKNLLLYAEGVYYDIECSTNSMNHAVTVVGYGVRGDSTYWIVKNSWGTNWGEAGYVLLSANNDNCGLMDSGYYAIV